MRLYNITTQKEGSLTIKADSDDELTKAMYTLSEEEVESLIHWEQGCAKFISNYKDVDPSDETTPYDFNAREIILTNIARENIEIAWTRFLKELIAPARNMSDEQKRNLLILIVEREIKEMAQDTDALVLSRHILGDSDEAKKEEQKCAEKILEDLNKGRMSEKWTMRLI